jgi:hypothetical protein
MAEIPYVVTVGVTDTEILAATLGAFDRLDVATHTLSQVMLENTQGEFDVSDIVARDIGFYSVLGYLQAEENERPFISGNYYLGVAKTSDSITLRTNKPPASRIEHLGSVQSTRDLGFIIADKLHPVFLDSSRLHRLRQRKAA